MNSISQETITILKNFATIQKNFLGQGKEILTLSEDRGLFATANIEEDLPKIGIYDLNEFLNAYSLFENPTIDIGENGLKIKGGKTSLTYTFADESILSFPPKKLTMPAADVTVQITNEVLTQIRKGAGVLGHSVMSISSSGDKIVCKAFDPKDKSANTFEIEVGENSGNAVFDFHFLISRFKFIPGDYDVSISSRLISQWVNTDTPVEYFLALEKSSSYGA